MPDAYDQAYSASTPDPYAAAYAAPADPYAAAYGTAPKQDREEQIQTGLLKKRAANQYREATKNSKKADKAFRGAIPENVPAAQSDRDKAAQTLQDSYYELQDALGRKTPESAESELAGPLRPIATALSAPARLTENVITGPLRNVEQARAEGAGTAGRIGAAVLGGLSGLGKTGEDIRTGRPYTPGEEFSKTLSGEYLPPEEQEPVRKALSTKEAVSGISPQDIINAGSAIGGALADPTLYFGAGEVRGGVQIAKQVAAAAAKAGAEEAVPALGELVQRLVTTEGRKLTADTIAKEALPLLGPEKAGAFADALRDVSYGGAQFVPKEGVEAPIAGPFARVKAPTGKKVWDPKLPESDPELITAAQDAAARARGGDRGALRDLKRLAPDLHPQDQVDLGLTPSVEKVPETTTFNAASSQPIIRKELGEELGRTGVEFGPPGLRRYLSVEVATRPQVPFLAPSAANKAKDLLQESRRGIRALRAGVLGEGTGLHPDSEFKALQEIDSATKSITDEFGLDESGKLLATPNRWSPTERLAAGNALASFRQVAQEPTSAAGQAASKILSAWKTLVLSMPQTAAGVGMLHGVAALQSGLSSTEAIANGYRLAKLAELRRLGSVGFGAEGAASVLAKEVSLPGGVQTTLGELEDLMTRFGVTTGGLDPAMGARVLSKGAAVIRATLGSAHTLTNIFTETLRRGIFIDSMIKGFSPEQAAEVALKYAFDYSTSEIGREFAQKMFSFGSATVKNLSLQGKELLTNPGAQSLIARGQGMAQAKTMRDQGVKESDLMPSQQRKAFVMAPVAMRTGPQPEALRTRLPPEDIGNLVTLAIHGDVKGLTQEVLSKIGPFGLPAELAQGKTFSGSDLTGQRSVGPVTAGVLASMSPVSVRQTNTGPIADAKSLHVLSELFPPLSMLDAIAEFSGYRKRGQTDQEAAVAARSAAGVGGFVVNKQKALGERVGETGEVLKEQSKGVSKSAFRQNPSFKKPFTPQPQAR